VIIRQHIKNWLEAENACPMIDMRSPGEFEVGHIPGAQLLPFFSDEERSEIGTLYKKQGSQDAVLRGLELIGPRLRALTQRAIELAIDGEVRLHCWRGGNRSGAAAQVFSMAGLTVRVLEGGYKAYRAYAHAEMANPHPPLVVLAGPTGSGKTLVLQALKEKGQQVIDLEMLANHKGSAFGWIAEKPQLTNEQFENQVFEVYRQLDPSQPVWLEDESRGIGLNFIPESLWERMKTAPRLYISLPNEQRKAYLVDAYGQFPQEDLARSFGRIRKRLGGQHVQRAVEALECGDLALAAEIALTYYDKTYQHSLERHGKAGYTPVEFRVLNPPAMADVLIERVSHSSFFSSPTTDFQ
jgi:tRNA 2-selenouridine synthase